MVWLTRQAFAPLFGSERGNRAWCVGSRVRHCQCSRTLVASDLPLRGLKPRVSRTVSSDQSSSFRQKSKGWRGQIYRGILLDMGARLVQDGPRPHSHPLYQYFTPTHAHACPRSNKRRHKKGGVFIEQKTKNERFWSALFSSFVEESKPQSPGKTNLWSMNPSRSHCYLAYRYPCLSFVGEGDYVPFGTASGLTAALGASISPMLLFPPTHHPPHLHPGYVRACRRSTVWREQKPENRDILYIKRSGGAASAARTAHRPYPWRLQRRPEQTTTLPTATEA